MGKLLKTDRSPIQMVEVVGSNPAVPTKFQPFHPKEPNIGGFVRFSWGEGRLQRCGDRFRARVGLPQSRRGLP